MIKYLIMDVDGTLTDGKIYISEKGEAFKAFSVKDGCGIHDILIPHNIIPIVLTSRISKIVENRAKEIGIKKVYQGLNDKLTIIKKIGALNEIAYIGDDINDLPCMKEIKGQGIIGCPANACKQIKEIADFVSIYDGGNGAVREFIEFICDVK